MRHVIDSKWEKRSFLYLTAVINRLRQKSRKMLCVHIYKQLEADVVEQAQYSWGSLIVLVPDKGCNSQH